MKILSYIALTIAAMLPLNTAAQSTRAFTATRANEYALVYSLPTTAVDITIETEHVHRVPGEFHNYARRHLAITNAITEESTSVSVRSITISTRGIADTSNQWQVQFKNGAGVTMLLTADGRPLTINTEKAVAEVQPELPVAQAAAPTPLETEAARQAMTQDMVRSSSISKRAELAAQRIFELRDMRSDLLSGQSDNPPADGQAMQLVLDNLAGQEAALTAMFAGTEQRYTNVRTISFVPDSDEVDRQVIARISPYEGILEADNLAGAPLTLSIQILETGSLPLTEKGEPKRFPANGVAYAIPGTARISVQYEGRVIASADVTLAQLGCVFGIDPGLFTDKKAPATLQFDPTTGAIVQLAQ